MKVQIIISPAASGKTHACILEVRDFLARQPLAPVWVIVGDYRQAADFRKRLASSGGAIGVRIATFSDLFKEILEKASRRLAIASPAIVHRLIQSAICAADIQYYANLRGLPGFTLTVENVIRELERSLISPSKFADAYGPDRQPNLELASIYQQYQILLGQIDWTDCEGNAWLALEALENDPLLFADCALMVVDGFIGFTPAQLRALQLMALRSANTLITLPGDPNWTRSVYRGFQTTFADLQKDLSLEIIAIRTPAPLHDPLAYLEVNLFEPRKPAFSKDARQIYLLEARSPAEEAREAIRYLKGRILRDGATIGECAILVPNADQYFPHLRAAADEFGLPVRFAQSRPLPQAPAITALLNLLSLPLLNYPRRQVLDALRTPFFDLTGFGFTRGQADVLDLVSRTGVVIEGLDQWKDVFELLKARVDPEQDEDAPDEETSRRILPVGPAAETLQIVFGAFTDCIQPPAASRTAAGWVTWLENLLDAVNFCSAEPGSRIEDQSILAALRECLRGMILAENLFGDREIDYAAFIAELQGLLQGSGYRDTVDTNQDAIIVLRPIEAVGLRFHAVVLVGLSEGIFPGVEHPDPLLDEDTRKVFGMQPRLERNQIGLFYQAVTRSDRYLLLTRPYLSDTGDPWEPSPYWNAARALFPSRVRQVRPEDPRALIQAASEEEAVFWAVRREGLTGAGLSEEAFAGLFPRYEGIRQARVKLGRLLDAPDEISSVDLAPLALIELIRARYRSDHTWSASRLESFAGCPFRFFIENALAVEAHEPPEWDFDAGQLGSMLHRILERTYRETWDPACVTNVREKLHEVALEEFINAPAHYGFRPSPLWQAQQAELLERLEQTVDSLHEASLGWRPLRFEQAFGLDG